MRSRAIGRLDTEVSLRQSIMNGDLRLHYQPIVSLDDGRILGHEALVRWDHPTRGLLGPDQFINVAEETGLIVPLGAWVLQEACRQARRFQIRDPKWSRLTMSVNLSGRQLGQPDLIELIASALDDADLRPEHLQLEMTESILMDDAAATIGILRRLKGLGVRLDVDDFGTGYSSLAYLKRFPVDVLKIDHSFVRDLGKDPEDSAIVAAVVSLADAMGFNVIAEGVETDLQRDCLVGLGCTRAQGYLFAHPVEAAEAETALDHAAGRFPDGHGSEIDSMTSRPSPPAAVHRRRRAMDTWEYLIVSLPKFEPAKAAQGNSAAVKMLNREGDKGWEAVGMTALDDGSFAVLLKRSDPAEAAARQRANE